MNMKKAFGLICSLFFSFTCFAQKGQQSIGLSTGLNNTLNLDYAREFGTYQTFQESFFSPFAGIYYDHDLTSRLGISLSVRYLAANAEYNCEECRFIDAPDFPLRAKIRSSYLEVPVNLTINLNKRELPAWRSYFVLGYTYSRLLQVKRTDLSNGNEEFLMLYADQLNQQYLNVGYEVRRKIKENYIMALSPYFRYQFSGNPERHNVGLQLKFGRSL
jgi:hypothetical protein